MRGTSTRTIANQITAVFRRRRVSVGIARPFLVPRERKQLSAAERAREGRLHDVSVGSP